MNKVRFPREVLPLASVGAALVHFFLQSTVLVAVLAVVRYNVDWTYMWLVPIALVTLLVFAAGLGILFSAMNVYLRDTGHLLELWMMAWFWLSPILYGYMLVADKLLSAGVSSQPPAPQPGHARRSSASSGRCTARPPSSTRRSTRPPGRPSW